MLAPTTSSNYVILEAPANSDVGYQPYGASRDLWYCKDQAVVISGPAETGKTLSALQKLDALAWKYPRMRAAIVRKTYQSAIQSVVVTFEKKVLGAWNEQLEEFDHALTPVQKYGGERPQWYDYPNGSRIVIGGLDKPGKVLSSEYDVIYVNQAEELGLDDWEILGTRCTGRAGNMPYAQLMGDCNPAYPQHWILSRHDEKKLTFLESRHRDNPTLFDPVTGKITVQGQRTMAVLEALTGVRRLRLKDGKWVQAEGVVYEEYDAAVHLIDRFDVPATWRRIRVVDFGYTNPFVCLWLAIDDDGRMYLYREIYMTQRTVATHLRQINRLSEGERIEATVCDHDAEDRATLEEGIRDNQGNVIELGIPTVAADRRVSVGIDNVKERLKVAGDGKPRFFIMRDSLVEVDQFLKEQHRPVRTEDEASVYIWNDKRTKDEPVKENDHGMDTLRYGTMYVDAGHVDWSDVPQQQPKRSVWRI